MLIFNRGECSRYGTQGFTLVELIAVMVILGFVAAIGASFVVSTIEMYDESQKRFKLVQRSRVVIEQLSRKIRIAAPNSVRVSASGKCLEYLPLLGASRTINDLPDSENGAPMVSSTTTIPFILSAGTPSHVIAGALLASEIYTSSNPASRVAAGTIGASPISVINFASAHRFLRNSVSRRIIVTADPIRFCITGENLYQYSGYGFSASSLNDVSPGGTQTLMTNTLVDSSSQFTLSSSSEDRNTAVLLNLTFSEGSLSLTLPHQILVRNVP